MDILEKERSTGRAYSASRFADEFCYRLNEYDKPGRKSRRNLSHRPHRSRTAKAHERMYYVLGMWILIMVCNNNRVDVDEYAYGSIHMSQWCNDKSRLEMLRIHKDMAVQVKLENSDLKADIFLVDYLVEREQTYDSSRIHEGAIV